MEYINLNHLKSFYTVARFKSYSKASQNLLVQQPALSKTVKTLEEDLGVQLFQRVGRGVELTREGEYIYSRCHEIFAQVEQIKNYARNEDVPLKESITIVCSDLIATKVMPSLISELTPLYPAIRPIVSSGMSKEMLALIKEPRTFLSPAQTSLRHKVN